MAAVSSFTLDGTPRTVEDIFTDYSGRRNGLIRALTHDVDELHGLCDPEKDNLCLFGYPNENWEVSPPSETVPPELPEPTLGINFARDSMSRRDWLFLVAVHSDSWLMAVAFFCAAVGQLNASERRRLFSLINNLPDVYEVVRKWKPVENRPRKEDKPGEASGSKSTSSIGIKRSSDGSSKSTQQIAEENHVVNDDQSRGSLCGRCGGRYSGDEFWIACDVCMLWYHGKCVAVTPTMAESIGDYECPFCKMKKAKK